MQLRVFHTAPDNPITENYVDPATGELYEADPRRLCEDCTTPAIDIETTGTKAVNLVHDPSCPYAYVYSVGLREFEVA